MNQPGLPIDGEQPQTVGEPAFDDSHVRRRKLPVAEARAPLSRHPQDGWQLAEPYPLGAGARRALLALILALCPPPPAPSSAELLARVEAHVRRFLAYMHPLAARGFWLCLFLLDWSPLWTLRGWRRLHALPRGAASELLTQLVVTSRGPVRTLVIAVRGLVMSAYFDQEEVHQALQYAPQPFLRERIALRRRLLEPALATAGGRR